MRVTKTLALCLLLSTCVPVVPAEAQQGANGNPAQVVTRGLQEFAPLIRSNVSAGAYTLYGGSYIFAQTCTGYASGSVTLSTAGPGGAGSTTLVTASAPGSAQVILGSNAVVAATPPAGSTGCVADLSRVP